MAAHPRLGRQCAASIQRVAASSDLLFGIMRHVSLVVPDDVPTLAAAVRMAGTWQHIVLRAGEHLVDSRGSDDPGSSQLRLRGPVHIHGESAASTTIRGTIVAPASCGGGSIKNVRLDDGGDCCLRVEGGRWELHSVRLRCSHGSALFACGVARISLTECVLGGESESEIGQHVMLSAYGSIQLHGLSKRACYAMVVRDDATAWASDCSLRQCSEAALLVAHRSHALLTRCTFSDCTTALVAGHGRGRALELRACVLEQSVPRLWFDEDRPRAFVWSDGSVHDRPREVDDDDGGERPPNEWTGLHNLPPRGAAPDDDESESDDSLQEQAFADMEALMQEMDAAALGASAAVRTQS